MAGIGTITNPIAAVLFLKLLIFNDGGMLAALGFVIMAALFFQGTPEVFGLVSGFGKK